jgi:starch synthase
LVYSAHAAIERSIFHMEKGLAVWFLSSELAPLIKIGGLGDMAGSFPLELRKLGCDARVALPVHPNLRSLIGNLPVAAKWEVPSRDGLVPAEAYLYEMNGLPVYLIDGPFIRDSDAPYHADAAQDAHKYIFFSIAALLLARALGWHADIVQTNDWLTAAATHWLALNAPADPFFLNTRSLLTVHNLPFVGNGAEQALALFQLDRLDAWRPERYVGFPEWGRTQLLPLGLAAADRIVTVSPTYAEEILTPEFGCSMELYLRGQKDRISGILNGLDYEFWDPAKDSNLRAFYNAASLDRKLVNKQALQEKMGLAVGGEGILAGMVSRLTMQKGVEVALGALDDWCARGHQAVVLGSGDPGLEEASRAFAAKHPGMAAVYIGYNAELASLIYGGSDVFVMPSRYEPCGISQMIAMRYGSVPVVRAVGGLKDTVRDVALGRGTGFLFEEESQHALAGALWRAEALYREPERWQKTQARGMKSNFTWNKSVQEYMALFQQMMAG